jgi:hypothetical protein
LSKRSLRLPKILFSTLEIIIFIFSTAGVP